MEGEKRIYCVLIDRPDYLGSREQKKIVNSRLILQTLDIK